MKKFTSVVVGLAIAVAFAVPANAADTFTVDTAPQVGVTSTIDATAIVPWNASVTTSVVWRSPGCCGATHTIAQLGRTPVTHWTPTALDATRAYVIIVVDVGTPNPANRLIRHTIYQQSFVVTVAAPVEA